MPAKAKLTNYFLTSAFVLINLLEASGQANLIFLALSLADHALPIRKVRYRCQSQAQLQETLGCLQFQLCLSVSLAMQPIPKYRLKSHR